MPKTRVLILDDHTILRQGIARLLNAEPDMEVTIGCGTVGEGLIIVAAGLVDVVILDIDLGTERGTEFLAQARRNGFEGPVLVLTAGIPEKDRELLESLGVSAILRKDSSVDLLADRVREAVGGLPRPALPGGRRDGMPDSAAAVKPFTPREATVLRHVVEGLANKEIATALDTSEPVVKAVLQQLFKKTGARTRSQLVRVALERHRDQL